MMKDWQDAFFKTMRDRMQILMGDTPPQPTAGSSIPQRNTDPNELRQLSPSGDRERSRAQHKSGTKRADGCSRSRSPAGNRSEASRDSPSHVRDSSASSLPPSEWLRADSRSPVCRSCSQDHPWWSPGPRCHCASPQSHPVVVAVPLPHTSNVVGPEMVPLSLVGPPRPAWLGDLPGTCPCHPDDVLLCTRCSNHPGAIVHPFAPGGCPLIAAASTPPLGHLRLDLAGDRVPVLAVHAPSLLTGIVSNVCTRRINVFSGDVTFLLCFNRMRTWMLTRIRQLMIPGYRLRNFLTTYSVLQLFPIMLILIQLWIWQTISWYLTIRMPLKPHPHPREMN